MRSAQKYAGTQGFKLKGFKDVRTANLVNEAIAYDISKAGKLKKGMSVELQQVKKVRGMNTKGRTQIVIETTSLDHGTIMDLYREEPGSNWSLIKGNADFKYNFFHELGHTRRIQYTEIRKGIESLLISKKLKPIDFGEYVAFYGEKVTKRNLFIITEEAWAEFYAAVRGGHKDLLPKLLKDLAEKYLE